MELTQFSHGVSTLQISPTEKLQHSGSIVLHVSPISSLVSSQSLYSLHKSQSRSTVLNQIIDKPVLADDSDEDYCTYHSILCHKSIIFCNVDRNV